MRLCFVKVHNYFKIKFISIWFRLDVSSQINIVLEKRRRYFPILSRHILLINYDLNGFGQPPSSFIFIYFSFYLLMSTIFLLLKSMCWRGNFFLGFLINLEIFHCFFLNISWETTSVFRLARSDKFLWCWVGGS